MRRVGATARCIFSISVGILETAFLVVLFVVGTQLDRSVPFNWSEFVGLVITFGAFTGLGFLIGRDIFGGK